MTRQKLSQKITQEGIKVLRESVENYLDRRMVTPTDFDYLSLIIDEWVHKSVSATTLKRVWGYVRDNGDDYIPGRYTASALAQLIGYRDYEDFVAVHNEGDVQSAEYSGESLASETLQAGDRIEIKWTPGRRCVLEYVGDKTFNVVEAVNSRLLVGDRVECAIFMQRAPLYFSRVSRAGQPDATYIAGSRTGIRWTRLDPADTTNPE